MNEKFYKVQKSLGQKVIWGSRLLWFIEIDIFSMPPFTPNHIFNFSSFTNGTLRNVHQLKRKREMAEIISRLFLNNQLDMRRVVNRVQSFVNEHLNLILCLLYLTIQKRV